MSQSVLGQLEPLKLKFGICPSDRAAVLYRQLTPVLDAITKPIENQLKQDVEIELHIFENYSKGIQSLVDGRVDFCRLEPASYVLAEMQNENIGLLAMELQKGLKRINGVIITQRDSGIKELVDLRNKTFAFGEEHSTIGRFLAQSELVNNNITSEDLKHFLHFDRHDLVVHAVLANKYDAGAISADTYKKYCDPEEVIVVKAFENVTKPWVSRENLPEAFKVAITAALLTLEASEVLTEINCSGFVEGTSEEYDLVRNAMKHAEDFYPKTKEPEIE